MVTRMSNGLWKFKEEVPRRPVLIIPDPLKQFFVEYDASKWATGAVLQQLNNNGDLKPCGYISHSLMATERNYNIYDREMLGIIRALQTWRYFLEGSKHKVIILSDHKNLTYFRKVQKLNCQQAQWALCLTRFNTKLMHVPGSKMVQSDTLSRRPDHIPEEDTDNEDLILLPDELFINLINIEDSNAKIKRSWSKVDCFNFLAQLGNEPIV